MLVFPRRIEHAFDVAVQRSHHTIRANIGGPLCSATSNSACIAACHSSASRSALGSLVMALRRVAERNQWFPALQNDRIEKPLIP